MEIDEFILREVLDVGEKFKNIAGMLAVVRKKLSLEPSFNNETCAITKADLLLKSEDEEADNIVGRPG